MVVRRTMHSFCLSVGVGSCTGDYTMLQYLPYRAINASQFGLSNSFEYASM